MIFLKSFKLFENLEILNFPMDGWVEVDPKNDRYYEGYTLQMEHMLTDNVGISISKFGESENIWVSMFDKRESCGHGVGKYGEIRDIDGLKKESNNYDQMMSICRFSIPFFDKPNDDIIEFIKDVFVDITDMSEEFMIDDDGKCDWGYTSTTEEYDGVGFPAKSVDDKLSLSLCWRYTGDFERFKEEYEYSKDKLKIKLKSYTINIYNFDSYPDRKFVDIVISDIEY